MYGTPSPVFTITSENAQIPVTRLYDASGTFPYTRIPVTYASIPCEERASVTVTLPAAIERARVFPEGKDDSIAIEGNTLTITTGKYQKRAVMIEGYETLFLFFDPNVAIPEDKGAVALATDRGIEAESERIQTDAINKAIAEISAAGGGVLRFPKGIYRTGTIDMANGVYLYLDEGAVLHASDNVADFPLDPEGVLFTDLPGSLVPGTRRRFIRFDGIENAGILGKGAVDGNGSYLRVFTEGKRPLINLVRIVNCKNIHLEGVCMNNSEFWNTHILLSEEVLLRNVKLVNEIPHKGWDAYKRPDSQMTWNNADGINPDSSRNVLIEECFLHTGDDCIPVKNTGTHKNVLRDVENIHARRCLCVTPVTALKIGTETRGKRMANITFEDINIVHASRAIGFDVKDSVTAESITFRNIHVAECNRPFDITVITRNDQEDQREFGRIQNVLIDTFTVDAYKNEGANYRSHIHGQSAVHGVSNVTFRNTVIAGHNLRDGLPEDVEIGDFVDTIRFE